MKRDRKTIEKRIKALGITNKHVANQCGISPVTLSRIITGVQNFGSKETIESIHAYLDKCKTRLKDFK